MTRRILAVARTELRLGIRNQWVVLAALTLMAFALVLGLFGAAATGEVRAGRMVVTAASLATLSVYLVPLIALLLSFDAIAGEVDRNTLPLLLATPISRAGVVLGKFFGQLCVVALAIVVGYGIAGAVIIALSGGELADGLLLARLIAMSIGLGAAFLAIGYIVSALAGQTGTAAALAVGVWLGAVVLYDLALLGILVADHGGGFATTAFPYLLIANPADAFRLFTLSSIDLGSAATGFAGVADGLPFPPQIALATLAGWIVIALAAAVAVFKRIEP